MPWFHEFLTSISRSGARSRPRLGVRVLAAGLSVVLALASVAPGVAFAAEADSEQEGSAAPGALPGLEEAPELEPGGEEAVLEEPAGAPVGGEAAEEGPPLESEPPQEPEPTPGPAAEAAQPPAEEAPSTPGPEYEPAPVSPSAPVENEPLAAPENVPSSQPNPPAPEAVQSVPESGVPSPAGPPEMPEPEAAPPAATPVQRNGATGSLAGHSVHTVRPGECLWSIAEALLPAGASNSEIEAEVQRLWQLNTARIGTGDPSLLYVGTELRLH
jgi:LysM domain